MPTYKAPVDDVQFLLNDVFHMERYGNLPGFSDVSPDTLAAILEEAARTFGSPLTTIVGTSVNSFVTSLPTPAAAAPQATITEPK